MIWNLTEAIIAPRMAHAIKLLSWHVRTVLHVHRVCVSECAWLRRPPIADVVHTESYLHSNNNYACSEDRMRWWLVSPFAIFFNARRRRFSGIENKLIAITCSEVKCATWLSINFIAAVRRIGFPAMDFNEVWHAVCLDFISVVAHCIWTIFPFDHFFVLFTANEWTRTRPKHLLNFLCRTVRSLWLRILFTASTAACAMVDELDDLWNYTN